MPSTACRPNDNLGGIPLRNAPRRYVPALAVPRPAGQATAGIFSLTIGVPAITQDVGRFLGETIYSQFVEPALREATPEEYVKAIAARWHEYRETLDALHVVIARTMSEEKATALAERSTVEAMEALREKVITYAGEGAADEVEFSLQTYLRAARVAVRIASLGPATDVDRDAELCRAFHNASALHVFGIASLCAITGGFPCEPAVATRAFSVLREGALGAYVAAREAVDLRAPREAEAADELPFDEEDRRLADVGVEDVESLIREST